MSAVVDAAAMARLDVEVERVRRVLRAEEELGHREDSDLARARLDALLFARAGDVTRLFWTV